MFYKASSNRIVIRFIVRFTTAYFIGHLGFSLINYTFTKRDQLDPFTTIAVKHTGLLLSSFDFDVGFSWNDPKPNETKPSYHSIYLDDTYAISIAGGCNGLNLILLFMAFILAFPSSRLRQFIFILVGVPILHFANLCRLGGLCYLNTHGHREHFYFYHKYAFTLVLYGLILVSWYFYLKATIGTSKKALC